MQDFATGKAAARGGAMPKLNCSGLLLKNYRHAVRIMKITAFILLAFCLQVAAKTKAQGSITLKEKGASIIKVMTEVQRQTGYDFLVTSETINRAKPVDIEVKDAPLSQVLEIVFKNQPLTYTIKDKLITIRLKAENKVSSISQDKASIDVRGKVVNENGEPVEGVTVNVKGTSLSVTTNYNGEFLVKGVDDNATLVFTSVNMESFELKVNGKTFLDVALQTKITAMQEVVINKGYYTEKRRLSTGNVGKVTSKDIARQPVNNPLLALQARVPGLFITQASGLPGSGIVTRIQGQNSILNGNDPFIVIDGVPYTSQMLTTVLGGPLGESGGAVVNGVAPGKGNPLSFINPMDIESIEILKDADATAIYGSRAANGAILITTKKGRVGKTKVDINAQSGIGKVTRKIDLLNTSQYVEMRKEAIANDGYPIDPNYDYDINGLWDTTRYTDWQKVLLGGEARFTDISASASGGNKNLQYRLGGTYHKETTVFPGRSSDQKTSVHLNLNNVSANEKLSIQFSSSYLFDNNHLPQIDLTTLALTLAPDAPALYNADGSLNWMPTSSGSSTWINPLRWIYREYESKASNLIANTNIGYKIFPELEVKINLGYSNLQINETSINPLTSYTPEQRPTANRTATFTDNLSRSWIIEPQLNFGKSMRNSRLEVLVGLTFQETNSNGEQLTGRGYNSDVTMNDIRSASSVSVTSSTSLKYNYNAGFARINYNLFQKYILNLTGRRDGSSRFGAENQFHNFGSIGGAWIFSEEHFLEQVLQFLSFGKLRLTYGTSGNDQIGDYQFMNLYRPISAEVAYQGAVGVAPISHFNPFLQWEETRKIQGGLDLGFFQDKLMLSTSFAQNESSNQLLGYALPGITGFPTVTVNFPATIQNRSWEFALNTADIKIGKVIWSSSFNATIPTNKLVDFPNLSTSTYGSTLIVGQPLNTVKAFRFAGVDPATGVYQFYDRSGNLTSNPASGDDQTVLINTMPRFYGGFQNTLRYKGFEIDFLFQFVKRTAANYFFGDAGGASFNTNQPAYVHTRWQKPGDITNKQKYNSDFLLFTQTTYAQGSDAGYSDASFIRLKNASLSWSFPDALRKKARFENARVYVQAQNLLTITNYKGMDPENASVNLLPPLQIVTAGIQITF